MHRPGFPEHGALRQPLLCSWGWTKRGDAAPQVPTQRPEDAAGHTDKLGGAAAKLGGAAAKPVQLLRPSLQVLAAPVSSNRNVKY